MICGFINTQNSLRFDLFLKRYFTCCTSNRHNLNRRSSLVNETVLFEQFTRMTHPSTLLFTQLLYYTTRFLRCHRTLLYNFTFYRTSFLKYRVIHDIILVDWYLSIQEELLWQLIITVLFVITVGREDERCFGVWNLCDKWFLSHLLL